MSVELGMGNKDGSVLFMATVSNPDCQLRTKNS